MTPPLSHRARDACRRAAARAWAFPLKLGLCSGLGARLAASRWARPAGKVAFVVVALAVLAVIGRTAIAHTTPGPAPPVTAAGASPPLLEPPPLATALAGTGDAGTPPTAEPPAAPAVEARPRGPATSDDPVVLNAATVEDLRRLPGIGEKRALAILTLRSKLGRFRQVEDLLRVKGIGRSTLKRLRPLVRLDAPAARDAGADAG